MEGGQENAGYGLREDTVVSRSLKGCRGRTEMTGMKFTYFQSTAAAGSDIFGLEVTDMCVCSFV